MSELVKKHITITAEGVNAVQQIDDKHIVYCSSKGHIKVVDIVKNEYVYALQEDHPINDLMLLDDDRIAYVMTGPKTNHTKIWAYKKSMHAELVAKSEYRNDGICRLSSQKRKYIAVFPNQFQIKVLGFNTGEIAHLFEENEERASQFLHVSQLDENRIIWLSHDQTFSEDGKGFLFCISDIHTGKIIEEYDITYAISVSPYFSSFYDYTLHSYARLTQGKFAMGFQNGVVRLWNIGNEDDAQHLQTNREVNSIAPVSDRLFATESEGKITLWNQYTLEEHGIAKVSTRNLDLMVQLSDYRLACVNDLRQRIDILELNRGLSLNNRA